MAQPSPTDVDSQERAFGEFNSRLQASLRPLLRPSPILTTVNTPLRGIEWPTQQPSVYFNPPTTIPGFTDIHLGPGTIWILSTYFGSTAPAASYVGLHITGGTIHFSAPTNLAPSPIVARIIGGTGKITISCQLANLSFPATPNVTATTPQNVTFELSHDGTGLLTQCDPKPSITLYGKTFQLTGAPISSSYDSTLGRIGFQFATDVSRFEINTSNELTKLQTSTDLPVAIVSASWSIPDTVVATASGSATPGTQLAAATADIGGVSLNLGAGIQSSFLGTAFVCGSPSKILVSSSLGLFIVSPSYRLLGPGPRIRLWNNASTIKIGAPKSQLAFGFVYFIHGSAEKLFLFGSIEASFDQPRNVRNEPSYFASNLASFNLQNNGEFATGITFNAFAEAVPSRTPILSSYAMKNLLLKERDPESILLRGLFTNFTDPSALQVEGHLDIRAVLVNAVPFLPDPYASNIAMVADSPPLDRALASIETTKTVDWFTPPGGDTAITVDVQLPTYLLQLLQRNSGPDPNAQLSVDDRSALFAIETFFGEITGLNRQAHIMLSNGSMMLDLSSNVSQFGVAIAGRPLGASEDPSAPVASMQLAKDLLFQLPAVETGVMTLPAVSWEPIVTDPSDDSLQGTSPFPSPLYFPNSGPTTVFVPKKSTSMVPVAPRFAIDALIADYNPPTGPTSDVGVRFTLPCGMVAATALHKPGLHPILDFPPTLQTVQPSFEDTSEKPSVILTGGDQLSIRAPFNPFDDGTSQALKGVAYQTHNGLNSAGVAKGQSALGDLVTGAFNTEFGPGGSRMLVPVVRADFSGWGESVFSNWSDPTATTGQVSKANFEVLIGRTAGEVVEVITEVLPGAPKVVATTSIQRLNSGVLFRRTKWKHVADGFYHFLDNTIVTHPGVVTGFRDLVNIHDTTERVTLSTGAIFGGLRYDCTIVLENCSVGQVGNGVPCTGVLGYFKIPDPTHPNSMSPAEYSELISKVGSKISASIDCAIDIGLSSQIMHINHLGVSNVDNPTGQPEFVMEASGSMILKNGAGAQWTFVRKSVRDSSPQNIDAVAGLPLIRLGPFSSAEPAIPAPATPQPYLFADGADLYNTDGSSRPQAEYYLLHSTGTQRLAMPRPRIEANGLKRITSPVSMLLADTFALGSSPGPFPPLPICLVLADPAQTWFQIGGGGNLTLHMDPITFALDTPARVLVQSTNVTSSVYVSRSTQSWMINQLPTGSLPLSTLKIVIDTTATDLPWSFSLTNLILVSTVQGKGEMSNLIGSIYADAWNPTSVYNTTMLWGPGSDPVHQLCTFIQKLGPLAPFDVSMTNTWSYKIEGKIDLAELLNLLTGTPSPLHPGRGKTGSSNSGLPDKAADSSNPLVAAITKIVQELDLEVEQTGDFSGQVAHGIKIAARINIPVGAGAVSIVAVASYEATFSSKGNSTELDIGGGLGLEWSFFGFAAKGWFALTVDFMWGSQSGFGGSFLVKAQVVFVKNWMQIGVHVELKAASVSCKCPDSDKRTVWHFGQATFGVEIVLCVLIHIDVSITGEISKAMDPPPWCPLIHT